MIKKVNGINYYVFKIKKTVSYKTIIKYKYSSRIL